MLLINAKNQSSNLLKIAKYEQNEAFVKSDYNNDHWSAFFLIF